MQPKRLIFIDLTRAFAILMMLQGHFVDTLMSTAYRDETNGIFLIWKYIRGITAPTFFTISGVVFMYLLLRAKENKTLSKRFKKGIQRGFLLILLGYLLKVQLFSWIWGDINLDLFLKVDVLHCIGLSILCLLFLFWCFNRVPYLFSGLLLFLGTVLFLYEPAYRNLDIPSYIPLAIANYVTKAQGSVFTIIPWIGYVFYGALIGLLFYYFNTKKYLKVVALSLFGVLGATLLWYSSAILMKLHYATGVQIFSDSANFNYLFTRLGNVLLIMAILYVAENYLNKPWITSIGQKTLSIYMIHYIVLYGGIFQIGLSNYFSKELTGTQAIFGAILFLFFITVIALNRVRTNEWIYKGARKILNYSKD
ncbi:hypothetical protein GCM10009117_24070 [Gangjinia marincola]|uniref:Heparan-alpha-glucosaminide N-acetyltransferase catalytic domain-containing protein n=1 Tax=Gangjinia marincola TaxID=578463 RepID=A0ABN1MJC4_9FLAO